MHIGISMNEGRRIVSRRARHSLSFIFALAFSLASIGTYAQQGEPLALSDALSRTTQNNPGLQVFDLRLEALDGRRITAGQRPALQTGVEVEEFLGTGESRGLSGAEFTLSLSSVLEMGEKRQARIGVVASRYGMVEAQRRAETLDVLGLVTQRFIATLALQHKLQLATETVDLAESTYEIVTRRVSQGAAPESEALRARASVTRSRIEQSRIQAALDSRKMALASLWGDTSVEFSELRGDLFRFDSIDSFDELYQRVSESPALRVYASEQRIREAEIQLARSQSESDLQWQVGIRRSEGTDDTALVAGVSVPLFTRQRNRGEVQAALAARDEVRFHREDTLLRLRSRLFEAYRHRQQSVAAVEEIQGGMLPDLTEAMNQTREAYERGRYSYMEWTAAQRELLSARQALIDAATTALLNQALIEQLTGQALTTSAETPDF